MREVVIVSAARTPVGKFQGSLASFTACKLGAIAIREVVTRTVVECGSINECIMGNVLSAGLGQNPARQAALHSGLSVETAALTINKVCGSGLKAVALAAQSIMTENADCVVAGGMESMSNAPYLLPKARQGLRMGDATVIDSLIHDGLCDAYSSLHMGLTAEKVAEKFQISREEQDAYALESHRKAVAAAEAGHFDSEIIPMEIRGKEANRETIRMTSDESVRKSASFEALQALRPAFTPEGTVTAGNAPSISDAAAVVLVMSSLAAEKSNARVLVRIVAQATSGVDPQWVMMAPVTAIRKVLDLAGWKQGQVDLFELNEAFSVQAIAVIRELNLDPARVNVNGGAVAIGHPIGASGARILVTLIHELERRNARKGIAALCLGGGNAVALAIERP